MRSAFTLDKTKLFGLMFLIMTIVASALLSPMCRNKDNMKGLYRESANAQKTGTM